MFRKSALLAALSSATLLYGCASPTFNLSQAQKKSTATTKAATHRFAEKAPLQGRVKVMNSGGGLFTPTSTPQIYGDVNIQAAVAPFGPIVQQIAGQAGYSVAFGSTVKLDRPVTLSLKDSNVERAVRTAAYLAGYATVFDKAHKTVYIGEEATYVFRLPSSVFSQLQATYKVGGNPINTAASPSGAGGASSSGGGSSGGSSLAAAFTVKGSDGTNAKGLTTFLQSLAGPNSQVLVDGSGLITVTGNAQALKRMHDFLENFARNAMTQVDIQASIVDVTLSNQFSMGIQWGKVLSAAGAAGQRGGFVGMNGATAQAIANGDVGGTVAQVAGGAVSNGLEAFRVGLSSSSIINALAQFTDVKVESQPHLISMNNAPATFFNGTQIPYLGTSQQTAGTAAGTQPTVTGSVSFAIDGLSFSVVPSVVSNDAVQITLVPVLSSVGQFSSFLNGTLQAPTQTNKESYMRVLAESGKTLILGGIRYSSDNRSTSVGANTGSAATSKEVVILLKARVIPPPSFDPLIGESL